MFDLNTMGGSPVIFNGGNTGLAKNVKITEVQRKTAEDGDNHPDYKVIISDSANATINAGFYIPAADATEDAQQREVGRVLHIAKAVLGADYQFPAVTSAKEAFDVLFGLIRDNAANKLLNVYVTYGTKTHPKKYLNLRYFEFIEDAANTPSRLRDKAVDLLERPTPDEPTEVKSSTSSWTS